VEAVASSTSSVASSVISADSTMDLVDIFGRQDAANRLVARQNVALVRDSL
jgi:hypothetical protein